MKTNKILNKDYYIYLSIIILYSLFLYLIYCQSGIVTINEAEKYVSASKKLMSGNIEYLINYHLFYCGYIFFITPFFAIGGAFAVIIAQAILSCVAAYSIKKSIDIITPANKSSILSMIIFLFSYPIQYWTLTLFSDSFFVSLICIALYFTLKKKNSVQTVCWLVILLVLIFTRPPGVFIALVFGCYYLYTSRLLSPTKILLSGILLLLLLFAVLFHMPVETKGYIKPIVAGSIIVEKSDYDIPEFNRLKRSSLFEAYRHLLKQHGFSKTAGLYFKKLISFFTLTRPYYSIINNSMLAAHYLVYLMAIIGLFALKNKKALILLFVTTIFLVSNLTALTYNEWHYRFTLAIFPFLIVLSVVSINFISSSIWPLTRK